jgi:hypothetical protein
MQIELKRISVSMRLSEETVAFVADLYINRYKAGYASNHGRGDSTDYISYDAKGRTLIKAAEEYCQSLPPEVQSDVVIDGKPMVIAMTLEYFIDKLLSKHLDDKSLKAFNRKLDKQAETGIVYGIENKEFRTMKFLTRSIGDLLSTDQGRDLLEKTIVRKVLPEMEANPEYKILNRNIPQEIIDSALSISPIIQSRKQKERQVKPAPGKSTKRGTRNNNL